MNSLAPRSPRPCEKETNPPRPGNAPAQASNIEDRSHQLQPWKTTAASSNWTIGLRARNSQRASEKTRDRAVNTVSQKMARGRILEERPPLGHQQSSERIESMVAEMPPAAPPSAPKSIPPPAESSARSRKCSTRRTLFTLAAEEETLLEAASTPLQDESAQKKNSRPPSPNSKKILRTARPNPRRRPRPPRRAGPQPSPKLESRPSTWPNLDSRN